MSTAAYPQPRPDRVAAQRNRDAAFARISRVRGLAILGAGALTAAVAAVVSAVAPGHTLSAKASAHAARTVARGPGAPHAAATLPPLASPSQLGLQSGDGSSAPPPQASAPAPQASAPQAAPAGSGPPVVSGGS